MSPRTSPRWRDLRQRARDDEFESILSVAKSTFEAQEREKRALKESIDTLKRDDEETRRALEAKLDALEEDVKRKKEVADALRLRWAPPSPGPKPPSAT